VVEANDLALFFQDEKEEERNRIDIGKPDRLLLNPLTRK